jgi:hypothetical protein
MTWWSSLAHKFRRRLDPVAQLDLAEAYRAVFLGPTTTREQREIVLSDLAAYTKFFMYHPSEATDQALRYGEGQRSVFGYINGQLTLTPQQTEALQRAARADAVQQQQAQAEEEFA